MSPDHPAIRVSHLGKKYSIGGPQEKYLTFRDAIVNSVKAPFKRLSSKETPSEFWALKDVSFDVEQGEVVGIIGRNGAGKSTLLKILSRITAPTEGTVDLYGRVGSLLEVGTGFHSELTGRENIFLSGSILGMKRREIDAKLDEIVKFSEIEKFLDTPVKRYSSGMYVRLAFSVAAYMDTEILLVDEVLAVGDAAFQKKCLGKMGDVATKEGRTVLFVSHNMSSLQNLCDRGFLIENGQIVFKGQINDTINKYIDNLSSVVGYNFANLSDHPERSSGMKKMLKSIDVKSGEIDGLIVTGGEIIFTLEFDSGQQKIDLIQLGICSRNGNRITTLGTHHHPVYINELSGRQRVECKVKFLPLNEGEYYITAMVGKRNPHQNFDYIENSVCFKVFFNDYYKTGVQLLPAQGNMALQSEWKRLKNQEEITN
jgi:lipopolysaccharide transport system ATP-binding protein